MVEESGVFVGKGSYWPQFLLHWTQGLVPRVLDGFLIEAPTFQYMPSAFPRALLKLVVIKTDAGNSKNIATCTGAQNTNTLNLRLSTDPFHTNSRLQIKLPAH